MNKDCDAIIRLWTDDQIGGAARMGGGDDEIAFEPVAQAIGAAWQRRFKTLAAVGRHDDLGALSLGH